MSKLSDRVNLSSRGTTKFLAAGLALTIVAATGCEEQIDVRGNLPHAKMVASIKPGVHKQRDVESILGTPSAVATFDKQVWYYIGDRVKTVSFFTPEVLERKVVTVRFDKQGVVESLTAKDAPTTNDVQLVDRETPTKGKELTLIQQLLGNVGRFGDVRPADGGNTSP